MRRALFISALVIAALAGCGTQAVYEDLLEDDPSALTDFYFVPSTVEAANATPLGGSSWTFARAAARVPIFDYHTPVAEMLAELDAWGLKYYLGPTNIIVVQGPSRHNFGVYDGTEHVAYGLKDGGMYVGPADQDRLANNVLEWGPGPQDVALLLDLGQIEPLTAMTRNNLAWAFATHHNELERNPALALQIARQANELSEFKVAGHLDTLAAAYAAVGNFELAVATQKQAIATADEADDGMHERLRLYESGEAYIEPEGVQDDDYVEPLASEVIVAARNGDADAQFELAAWLIEGSAAKLDEIENPGAHYLLLAAEQGHVDAIAETGYGLLHGYSSFTQDTAEAEIWLDRGIALNSALAAYNKAIMYRDAIGVTRNDEVVTEMLLRAAEGGVVEAALEAGFRLLEGVGAPVDVERAEKLLATPDATLKSLLFFEYDSNFWWVTNYAAEDALPPATVALRDYPDHLVRIVEKIEIDSLMARDVIRIRLPSVHIGMLRQDTSTAVLHLLRGAARLGSRKAQLRLADMYAEGIGVEASAEEEAYWLERAANNQRPH